MPKQKVKNIIWDLSGTLFKPMAWGLTPQEIADYSLIFYMWSGKNEPSKLDLYALECIKKAEPPLPEYQVIRLHTGDPVPAVECSLLAGLINNEEAYQKVMDAFKEARHDTLSIDELEQVKRMLRAFFNPVSLARCMHPIPTTERVVELCAENEHNTLYVLSNWDKESFAIFMKTYEGKNGLSHFNRKNILISADAGYIKPQPEMYDYFLTHFNLDPATCIFIDDQKENVAGAKFLASKEFIYAFLTLMILYKN